MKLAMPTFFLVLIFVGVSFAQTERGAGIELYKNKNYDAAIATLKKAVSADAQDSVSWLYLGLSYLGKNKPKDSIKALQKSIEINSNSAQAHASLGYVYLVKNDNEKARDEAAKSLAIDPKNADAYYVWAVVKFRDGLYDEAYEKAGRAVELNPSLAAAYLLRSQSLTVSFALQKNTVMKSASAQTETLREAAENLEKYLKLSSSNNSTKFYTEYLESLKFFAEYYSRPENKLPKPSDDSRASVPGETPIKILSKQPASYTDAAKDASVEGIIRVLVGFSPDGTTKHILVIKPLGFGLDEEAVKAAHAIKFIPPTKNGVPYPIVKIFEYSFHIGPR